MKISWTALFVIVCCSCQDRPAPKPEPTIPQVQVAVGDSWSEARERILASGAKVHISEMYYMGPGEYAFFTLKNGTALRVYVDGPKPGRVSKLTLGVDGLGFGDDKKTWLNQPKREPASVSLD